MWGTRDIAEQLNAQAVNGKIVSLDNMIDKVAMKEKLSTALRELGALYKEPSMDFFPLSNERCAFRACYISGFNRIDWFNCSEKPATECIKGTVKTIMGFVILGAGQV